VSEDRDIFLQAVQAADFLPTDVRESAAAVEDLERRILDLTYCDFLREQIALEPRGPEWTAILSKRLAAIAPFVGVPTLIGTIRTPGAFHYVRVDATTRRIIHCETHETNAPG